jgi:WD40 repeat protein
VAARMTTSPPQNCDERLIRRAVGCARAGGLSSCFTGWAPTLRWGQRRTSRCRLRCTPLTRASSGSGGPPDPLARDLPIVDDEFSPDRTHAGMRVELGVDLTDPLSELAAQSVIAAYFMTLRSRTRPQLSLRNHAPFSGQSSPCGDRRVATRFPLPTIGGSLWPASPLGTLTGHTDTVGGVAFSPDGHTLATGSTDTTGRLWETNIESVVARIWSITPTITKSQWDHYLPCLTYQPPCP